MLSRRILMTCLLAVGAGCSGEYILVAPDVAALPGGTAPVVLRLQRREFWFHAPPEEGAAVRYNLAGGAVRCARTDEAGYACVPVGVPSKPGRYRVGLHYQDELALGSRVRHLDGYRLSAVHRSRRRAAGKNRPACWQSG